MKPSDYLLQGVVNLFRSLPRGVLPSLANALGDIAYGPIGVRREVVRENLQRAFPEKTTQFRNRIARNCYRFFVRAVFDWLTLPERIGEFQLELDGIDIIRKQLRETGVILATGHIGYWEWLGAIMSRQIGGITVYGDRQAVEVFQRFVERHRSASDIGVAYGSLEVRHLLRKLNQRKLVGVVGDQRPRRRYEHIKFFNRRVRNMTILSYLVEKTGAVVVPGVALRVGERTVRVKIEPPLPESKKQSIRTPVLLRQFNSWLEDRIVEFPEQYFWLHNRFKFSKPLESENGSGDSS